MTGRTGLPQHIHELAVKNMTQTALSMAEDKNVPVTVEHCALFARNPAASRCRPHSSVSDRG